MDFEKELRKQKNTLAHWVREVDIKVDDLQRQVVDLRQINTKQPREEGVTRNLILEILATSPVVKKSFRDSLFDKRGYPVTQSLDFLIKDEFRYYTDVDRLFTIPRELKDAMEENLHTHFVDILRMSSLGEIAKGRHKDVFNNPKNKKVIFEIRLVLRQIHSVLMWY